MVELLELAELPVRVLSVALALVAGHLPLTALAIIKGRPTSAVVEST